MAKVIVWRVETQSREPIPENDPAQGKKYFDLRSLTDEQKDYFRKAHDDFRANPSFWDFDRKWLSPEPLKGRFSLTVGMALGRDKNEPRLTLSLEELKNAHSHPLYVAIQELWRVLGVNQGQMPSEREETIYFWL